GTVCVVGKMRDLILQLSKSSIYSTKPQIMYSPELLFYHDVSIQGKLIAPEWKVYYLCRNLILSKKIFQKNGVYSNSAIAIRILKYILILPWQRQKYSYMKFILRGISHGIKGISGKYH
ncbi:hypothetical protein JNS31_24345, partial [Klebsiella pneumoniae]|nr:hypothetical protein [Klebsiella pneumoniae]